MRATLHGPSFGPLRTTLWSSGRRRRRSRPSGPGSVLAFAVMLAIVIVYVAVRLGS